MQATSREPGGASKPVCRIALLPLLAPERMSSPASSSSGFSPAMARRRKMAHPTTPPPMMTTSARSNSAIPRGPELDCPEVERLRPGQHFVTDAGERRAAAGILHADPGQGWVQIIAAIHVDRAGVERVADLLRRLLVHGPECRGQAVL